jgi:3-dehydroquinate dehydratase-2
MEQILVLNGPNLNLLGTREPEVYGHETLDDIHDRVRQIVTAGGFAFAAHQSNGEQALIELVHGARGQAGFIIINPGAFTHTSIALRDALLGVSIPFIEVHLSNVFAREAFRHHSYLSDIAVGCITGLGSAGYCYAAEYAVQTLKGGE